MIITEENVVEQIINRNEKAIAYIIQRHGGLLSAIIRHHVHFDQQEYEECLDDVLLAVWFNINAFDEQKNSFKQWIAAIAKYRAIDYQRKMIRTRQQFISTDITDALYNRPSVSANQEVEELLTSLPPSERAVFEQYYLEGVPSKEMARQWNVKESWIHNKLSRGRKKLRQLFFSRNEV